MWPTEQRFSKSDSKRKDAKSVGIKDRHLSNVTERMGGNHADGSVGVTNRKLAMLLERARPKNGQNQPASAIITPDSPVELK